VEPASPCNAGEHGGARACILLLLLLLLMQHLLLLQLLRGVCFGLPRADDKAAGTCEETHAHWHTLHCLPHLRTQSLMYVMP
jgi:hypothetical protein